MEEIMFFIINDTEILNMDQVVSIRVSDHSDNALAIEINDTGGYIPSSIRNFDIKKKTWHELIEAIKDDKKVFVLRNDIDCTVELKEQRIEREKEEERKLSRRYNESLNYF
jgi:hypothetical protein